MISFLAVLVLAQAPAPCGSSERNPCYTKTVPYKEIPPRPRVYNGDAGSYVEDLSPSDVAALWHLPKGQEVRIRGDDRGHFVWVARDQWPVIDSCGNECGLIDRENVRLRDELAKTKVDLWREQSSENWGVALAVLAVAALTAAFSQFMIRLDRIVYAWRRSELSRVPWQSLGKWVSFLLAVCAWQIVVGYLFHA